jgi:hypothetical protein
VSVSGRIERDYAYDQKHETITFIEPATRASQLQRYRWFTSVLPPFRDFAMRIDRQK